ncbi:MAG TPA: riboflavin kinase [Patescibacteria group bacterium]|nr:riboflavin kinase [Patescibacteria group bacterium]
MNQAARRPACRQGRHQVSGKVIHGDHFGRKLGFPTANLDRREYVRRGLKAKFGVYAGAVQVQNSKLKVQSYRAGIVIGPLDKRGLPKIEAHLIGFRGNLYGRKLIIVLQKYLRPFKKYKNIEDLKKDIQKDIIAIKKLKIQKL